MALEELERGAVIDERTTVFNLGRTIEQLLDPATGWRGSQGQVEVAAEATQADPGERLPTVEVLAQRWRAVSRHIG